MEEVSLGELEALVEDCVDGCLDGAVGGRFGGVGCGGAFYTRAEDE